MARKYTKVEGLTEIIRERKANGETNREIGESYGLTKEQVKQLITRQNRKERKLAAGYILRMQVELLRNFLCEAGRR